MYIGFIHYSDLLPEKVYSFISNRIPRSAGKRWNLVDNSDSNDSSDTPPAQTPIKVILNRTARQIVIRDTANKQNLFLPPFGQLEVLSQDLNNLDWQKWRRQNLIRIDDMAGRTKEERDEIRGLVGCSFFGLLLVFGPIGWLIPALRFNWWYWGPVAAFTALVVLSVISLMRFSVSTTSKGSTHKQQEPNPLMGGINSILLATLILAIGLGLPGLTIYAFGGGNEFLPFDASRPVSMALLGRILQLFFIGIASALPAMLYIQFERQQVSTLRDRFFRDVVMLNPSVHTLDQAEVTYDQLVDEAYGSGGPRNLFLRGAALPILTSTLLIMLGWLLVLLPIGSAADIEESNLLSLLSPSPAAISFGFLGAYFFTLNMIFRRYLRSDLSPKAYNHVTYRLLITLVLVWVFSALPQEADTPNNWVIAYALITAFLVGIFPESGINGILAFSSQYPILKSIFPRHYEEGRPLSSLEGITIYDRSRLLEEGIENVENLAHSNFIELMLHTRIPTNRLVDLLDQAILQLHLSQAQALGDGEAEKETALDQLRHYGIRTATDLIQAYESVREHHESAEFLKILSDPQHQSEKLPPLKVILGSMEDDDWLSYLIHWRKMGATNKPIYEPEEFFQLASSSATPGDVQVVGELTQPQVNLSPSVSS